MTGVFYNENDPFAAAWLRELIKAGLIADGEVDERSIEDIPAAYVRRFTQCHFFAGIGVWAYALRLAGWPDDRPVWTASMPCQPFSAAGKGDGFADERHLWPALFHLVGECRPVVLFGEQVASDDGLAWLDLVQSDLEGRGYTVGSCVTPAAGFGAPHGRHRTYFVADAGAVRGSETAGLRSSEGEDGRRTCQCSGRSCDCGTTGELGNAGHGSGRAVQGVERDERRSGVGKPSPVGGFWVDADWVHCRPEPGYPDGRWRPVEPGIIKMVDGVAGRVEFVCGEGRSQAQEEEIGDDEPTQTGPLECVCEVPDDSHPEADAVGRPRKHEFVHEEKILRPDLHGGGDGGGHQGDEPEEQPPPVEKGCPSEVRAMREGLELLCPPQGREPAQQRPLKLEDVVRLLPSSLALAELGRDNRTVGSLLALLQARSPKGAVLDSPDKVEALWESLGKEGQRRLHMDLVNGGFVIGPIHPLVTRSTGRVVKIRGFGNCIVAPQAEAFIRAYLEARG